MFFGSFRMRTQYSSTASSSISTVVPYSASLPSCRAAGNPVFCLGCDIVVIRLETAPSKGTKNLIIVNKLFPAVLNFNPANSCRASETP